MVSDHHALSDTVLNLYLYGVGGWGFALLGLYAAGMSALAITLCFPLALFQIVLTIWWGSRLASRVDQGKLTREQAGAGVRSVGHVLAASSMAPAIAFMANDPFNQTAWSTTIGVCIVAGIAWGTTSMMALSRARFAHVITLVVACLAMPINSTGTVTVATVLGLYDAVVDHTPAPDVLHRND